MDLIRVLTTCVLLGSIVWSTLIGLAYSGCNPKISESQVVRMCYDNQASGRAVYVDTTGAKATDNSSGPLCVCNATIVNSKFVSIRVDGQRSACGSKLTFSSSSKTVVTNEDNCRITEDMVQIEQVDFVQMVLEKIKGPYEVDFCSRLEIAICSSGLYQCNVTGRCVTACDNFPDCEYNDDEDSSYCEYAACTESMTSCKDGKGCYGPSDVCDNVTKCSDGTDERGCSTQFDSSTPETKASSTEQIITIQCYESDRFSTTTTTTTTTTPTTTTPTTTTPTTTTPTTTTTTPTKTTPTTTTPTTTTPMTTTTTPTTTKTIPTTTAETTTTTTTTTPSTKLTSPEPTSPEEDAEMSTATSTKEKSTSQMTTVRQNFTSTADITTPLLQSDKPDNGIISILKKPSVIAGIVCAAVVLTAVTGGIIYAVRRKMKRSKSKNISPDLWVSDKGGKELDLLNKQK